MSGECQAQKPPLLSDGLTQRIFGREVRVRTRDPKFVAEVLRLRSNGTATEDIAKQLGCHRNTVMNVIRKQGDPLGKVFSILRDGMPRIADMVIEETLRKKDVRAGVALLQGAGQLDALKPKPQVEDGGRIVIEWSGSPPPWAPAPVLAAYAKRQAPRIEAAPADLHENVQIAEIVREDTNAEDGEAGVQS